MRESTRNLIKPVLALVGIAAVVGACVGAGASPTLPGSDKPSSSPAPSSTASAAPSSTAGRPISHPAGSKDLVFRLDIDGGLVAPGTNLGHLPIISVYGDGTVVTPGPQLMIYPPPARPSLAARHLSEAGLQRLLAAAEAAGLLGKDADLPANGIADAQTASFTVVANGGVHHVTAYALIESQNTDGLDPATIVARAELLAFTQQLAQLPTLVGADQITDLGAYSADRLRLIVSPMPVTNPSPSQITDPAIAWPLATPLASFGAGMAGTSNGRRCGTVEGTDLALLNHLIDKATEISPWTSGGTSWSMTIRPLLPDEAGCPG